MIAHDQVVVDSITDLGSGRYSVRLSMGGAENSLSQTQTVSAEGREEAVRSAKEAFVRWLDKVTDYTIRTLPSGMRN